MANQHWQLATESRIEMRTSRIGMMSFHAHAPVTAGTIDLTNGIVKVEFTVAIDRVSTGNPLFDPEVHALVRSASDGNLTFTGQGSTLTQVPGFAQAGNVKVPLDVSADERALAADAHGAVLLKLSAATAFQNISVPLPGLGHISHVEVTISGTLHVEPGQQSSSN